MPETPSSFPQAPRSLWSGTSQDAAEERAQAEQQVRSALNNAVVQDLRMIAKHWGWQLRGAAKADIIEQLLTHLTNPTEIAAGYRALPEAHREALGWLTRLAGRGDVTDVLRAALRIGGGHDLSKQAVGQIVMDLRQRALLLSDPYHGAFVPQLYSAWLPAVKASGLAYSGAAQDVVPGMDVKALDRCVEQLLTAVEIGPSQDVPVSIPTARATANAVRGTTIVERRYGLVTDEMLLAWGYLSDEEREMARAFCTWMVVGGLCQIVDERGGRRVRVGRELWPQWQALAPDVRQANLQQWWAAQAQLARPGSARVRADWDELDMALGRVQDYTLRQTANWLTRDQMEHEVGITRVWLLSVVQALQAGVWYDCARFLEMVYHLHRDLLQWTQYFSAWIWYQDTTPMPATSMSLRAWADTYGEVVIAWLTGPARWLGFVDIAMQAGRPVAFRRPVPLQEDQSSKPVPGMLTYLPDGTLMLLNAWQARDMREIVCSVAVETGRTREHTTYRLDAAAFRKTLREGQSVEQVILAFANKGSPLPSSLQRRLRAWQTRAGRHQIYDNLAVIEFGDDQTLAEIQATVATGRVQLYPVSPTCLVVLNPETVPELIEELRRRGYTPQVIA